ncbi:putative glutamine--tRNA ligase [Trichinella spiralis]|uniref:Probable glutamine--tRNA ligase n=1 Tax=Trichinella spiralis TaxID=6334 RepID=A0A0V1C0X7_TRISP|nr:putative glutamine--tRNA ligase [Trichinella spiralis]
MTADEGDQPQTSTGYLRTGSCLNVEKMREKMKYWPHTVHFIANCVCICLRSAIQYLVTISFMSGVSDDVDDEFWNDSNVSSFCFDDFPSDTAKIIEEIGAELNKLDLNSTDDEELGLFGGDHLTSSFNDEMSSVSNSQTPSDLRSISSETTEQRTTPLSVQATQSDSDDYKRLQAECSRLRSKWTELQCRLKQEKYFAPDFEETIGRLATGEIYIFQYYRRLSDKKQLLKTAIDFGDGDAICCVVLFLERTLSPVVFRQLLLEFPPAVSHYIFYLKQLSMNDKLSELLLSLGLVEQLAAVEVSRICSEKNAESKIALLRKALAGGVFADPSLNEERMFLNSYADLLEHQLPIDAADNSARVEGGLKNEKSVVDSSVLETLMYCCRLHYELPSNSLASPLSIRNKFALTEQQFDWIAIKALAERQQWAEIQKLLLRKGLFGKQKLKLPISCEQLLNVLYSNGATASDITIYIDLFSDNQRKLMLAKKYKCHALVIKILIGLKDRLELLKYMATLSPSSVELSTAETARMAFADNNQLLSALGLSGEKIKETLRNETLTASLSNMANQALKITNGKLSESQGKLLYQTATRLKKQCFQYAELLIEEICNNRLENDLQLSAALQFLLSHAASDFDKAEFEQACGIGVKVTEEQIEDTVTSVIKANEEKLQLMRYKFPISSLIAEVRKVLPWADGSKLKKEIDMQMLILLGPKTLDDMQSGKKIPSKVMPKEKLKAKETAKNEESEFEGAATIEELMKTKAHFHKPGENYKTEGYVVTPKTMDLLKRHLEITGGKVVTRFPPEPNGILHIGHAKAINIDFGYAKAHGGICYLRYDDTNPEKEEERYFTAIREMVEWLGYTPYKVTHSSDYFDQLYEYALELIRRGHAYVCHQKAEEVKGINPTPSPWRDRPIDESLKLFEDMKNGMFDEGAATLRMKITLEEGKVDPVAYRIKYVPHHRTGNKWCIYPTYDYTHCLCDSIENITHSLCTKEFQSRRSSYYWLCNALDLYCPVQWEFARLNVHYAVISKRKIIKLVQENIIRDWDDPRLFTLTALKRRGFPPQAINNFVAKMGLTTALTAVDPMMLEACVRDVLNVTAPRHMAVLNPLKVRFANPVELPKMVEVPDFPNTLSDKSTGKHHVQFDSTIFIEADDFKEHADDKHFKRFTSTQAVGLKYVGLVMILQEIKKNHLGEYMELIVKVEKLTEQNKPKCFIHWVAKPISCEVRLYERLFHHRNPEDSNEVPGGFLTDVNKDSLHVINDAYIDESLRRCAKVESRFQFERVGFFVVDPDSTDTKLVFNRTVSLKEDRKKKRQQDQLLFCRSRLRRTKKYAGQERCDGKIYVVTGADSGIGLEIVCDLVLRGKRCLFVFILNLIYFPVFGAKVYMGSRSELTGEKAFEALVNRGCDPQLMVIIRLRMHSFASVCNFADQIFQHEHKLDGLVNNAAVMFYPKFQMTENGHEYTWQVNYLGHALLTEKLLPLMKATDAPRARILFLVSRLQSYCSSAELDLKTVDTRDGWDRFEAYSRSKLALTIYAFALAKRLAADNASVTVNVCYPGACFTRLLRYTPLNTNRIVRLCSKPFLWYFLKTAREGAQTPLYCLLSPEVEHETGRYLSNFKKAEPSPLALDVELQDNLFNYTLHVLNSFETIAATSRT